MQKTINVGIIGCGAIAFSKHLPSLAKIPEVRLTAFCNANPEKARRAAKEFGDNAAVYTDYRRLLEDESIDVVHVLTPNRSHGEITVAALEAGKHVMCEKPMAADYTDAKKMLEASERTGKRLSVSYQGRFRPESRYLKAVCERGELGEIYFAKAHAIRRRAVPNWGAFLDKEQQGGGPLIDIGTHALDLTLWLMDNYAPKSVRGSVYHKMSENPNCGNAFGAWEPKKFEVEDSAFGFITMENGATIILESSWALNTLDVGESMTTLCGTKAGADMKDGVRINGDDLGRLYVKKPEFAAEADSPEDLEARAWIDALLYDKPLPVTAQQALVVTHILEGIYESARTGKEYLF